MTLQEVAARFPGGRWTQGGSEYTTRCPCHEDRKASLGIGAGDNGGVVMTCGAGCDKQTILGTAGLTLADLAPPNGNHSAPRFVASYRYNDANGNEVATKHRKADKSFVWQQANGDWNLKGVTLPLFGLPDLLKSKPGDLIGIAEGEKDVLSLAKQGLVATTNPHGAAKNATPKWTQGDTDWLAANLPGREFLIFADNDAAGIQHADVIYHSLQQAGLSVRHAQMEGLGPGEDISDWLARHSKEEFAALLKAPAPTGRFQFLSRDEIRHSDPPVWHWGNRIVKGSLVVIYGRSDAYKTFLTMDAVLTMLKGSDWCDEPVLGGAAVYINADSGHGFSKRLIAWEQVNGESAPHALYTINERINFTNMSEVMEFVKAMETLPQLPTALVIDTLARCYQGSENDADQMGAFIAGCDYVRKNLDCTVIVIHHTGKNGESERGSSALRAAADTMIEVSRDLRQAKVRCDKQRDAEAFADLHFELTPTGDSAVLVQIETPIETASAVKRHRREDMVLLIISSPGLTCEEISAEMGAPVRTVRRYKDELIDLKVIVEAPLPRFSEQGGRPPYGLFPNPGVEE